MKICTICKIEKDFTSFIMSKEYNGRKARYLSDCRDCRNKKSREKYHSDPNNRIIVRERARARVHKTKEFYQSNKERILQRGRDYRTTLIGRANQTLISARRRAKLKGLKFDLTQSWLLDIYMKGKCQKSGIPLDFSNYRTRENHSMFTPSLDKIDAFGDYTMDNCQVVVWCYNAGKGQNTDQDFIDFCKKVVAYNADK